MSDLNEQQAAMAETLEGMLVVDAGPGTGKTKTIVDRYVNIVSQEDVGPSDVLLMTFTRNAAMEMEMRIKGRVVEEEEDPGSPLYGTRTSDLVRVQTFDAFCLSIVKDYPDAAGRMFGYAPVLTRSVSLESNETLVRRAFYAFLDGFVNDHPEGYGPWPAVAVEYGSDLYDLIQKLLSRGIYPFKSGGWIGGRDGKELLGDEAELAKAMHGLNEVRSNRKDATSPMFKKVLAAYSDPDGYAPVPGSFDPAAKVLSDDLIESVAREDRSSLLAFVHDVYVAYVEDCMARDRLTFMIAAMLAFSVLYDSRKAREANTYRYLMIDEFQDTNASQIMMSLMILDRPNLCAVGDWKQGIYGFRYVSIEYILGFERSVVNLRRQLNEDGNQRVRFDIPEPKKIAFDRNYRSSQAVVDHAFRAMTLPAAKDEEMPEDMDSMIKHLVAELDGTYGEDTEVRFLHAGSKDDEPELVERCIREYVGSGRYRVVSDGPDGISSRPVRLKDIAVLCRTTAACRAVVDRLEGSGVPVFLQADMEIMATREGKLALAWLRYISNDRDPRGIGAVMADLGFGLQECVEAWKDPFSVPDELREQKRALRGKMRRVNELLTSIFSWYGISNDTSQAIVNVLSGMHSGSLLTVSDLISIMEEDIALNGSRRTSYSVETAFGADAVTVMTMHKAKGLEFPVVIIPYMDRGMMPLPGRDSSVFKFDRVLGVRSTMTVGDFQGYRKMCRSWRTDMALEAVKERRSSESRDEERRLLFVAMSRAKQYETLICGPKPSAFMTGLDPSAGDESAEEEDIPWYPLPATEEEGHVSVPDLSGYKPRKPTLAVHDLMRLDFEPGSEDAEADESVAAGRGKEYGTKVHADAQRMHVDGSAVTDYPECRWICDNVLSRIADPWGSGGEPGEGFMNSYSEIGCVLPLKDPEVVIRGVIDLMIVFSDHVEIHDYKTDGSERNTDEYRLQLSVYAHVAECRYPQLPVRCYIDYAYLQKTIEFDPLPMDFIEQRAREALEEQSRPPEDDGSHSSGESGIE